MFQGNIHFNTPFTTFPTPVQQKHFKFSFKQSYITRTMIQEHLD